ncbi:hypothetical protein QYF36_011197 [Acer negundo]|nr:hypothetical protein QYF36_011197 [Acer negundo]
MPIKSNVLLWSGVVPPKVDLFLWMLAKNRLLVGDLLHKFTGRRIDRQICAFCKNVVKSIDHLHWLGDPGLAGIGGILHIHVGDSICMFSSFLGEGLSSYATEISAIVKACELCDSDNCPTGHSIIIESDCKSVVRWVNRVDDVGNIRNLESSLEITEFLRRNAPKVLVRFVPRSRNVATNLLAKLGALSGLVKVVWRS